MKPDPTVVKEKSGLRLAIFSGLVLLVLGLLTVRLVQMQLLDRSQYTDEALANSVEQKIVGPARGLIYDRNGMLLVDNEPIYSVTLTPRYFEREKLGLLARLAGVSDSLAEAKYAEINDYSSYKTSLFLKDIPFQSFARVKEESWRLPGVGFEIAQKRGYHTDARASHALGYVREIDDDELERRRQEGYRLGDIVGKAGVEKSYETVLRGRPGREFVLVNVHGMEVMPYEEGTENIDPQSGYELHLTLDAKVQALAESLMVNMRGGAVALDVNTGGIIAMASAPDYDPTKFAGRLNQEFVDYIYRNEAKPLFNRATQMMQPPGSTWKPFMAAIALEEGMITEDTDLYCPGGYRLGGRLFKCHGGSHGNISVKRAIQVSCNTFFFRLMNDRINGKRMDLTTWGNWARRFGFGTLAPLDFPDQSPGLIPDSSYYDRIFPHGWGPGYTVNLGIGQGNMGTTPLQLARYTAAVATDGKLVTPHVVDYEVHTETGERIEPNHRVRQIPISEHNFEIVKRGMELVVEAGTARRAQIEGIAVAGKTGTSENPHGKDHSVFIAYAPADDPQIAVAVIIENAGYGSTAAAPIASLMIEQALTGEIKRPELVAFTRAQKSAPIETN